MGNMCGCSDIVMQVTQKLKEPPQPGDQPDVEPCLTRGGSKSSGSSTFPAAGNPDVLNGALEQMWPFLSKLVCNLLCDEVEPALKKAVGRTLGGHLSFDRGNNFGDKALRFVSTEVVTWDQQTEDGAISNLVIKAELDWAGDLSLKLRITTGSSVGQLGISGLRMRGTLVVELVGMLDRPPMFQGIRIYFLNEPHIVLEFAGLGHALLNSAHATISRMVEDAVRQILVVPNVLGCPFSDEFDHFRVMSPRPIGLLRLRVIRAEGLRAADLTGSSDPYVVLHCGAERRRSKAVSHTLHPSWSFCSTFLVWVKACQELCIEVWDEDQVTSDDFLGAVRIGVEGLLAATRGEQEGVPFELDDGPDFPNRGKAQGRIWLQAAWDGLLMHTLSQHPGGVEQGRGHLFVGIYSASKVPLSTVMAQRGARTEWWVQSSCSSLMEESVHKPQATKKLTGCSGRHGHGHRMKSDEALETKLELCKKYGICYEDMAKLMDVDVTRVEKLLGADTSPRLRMDECHLTWNQGFNFLVEDCMQAVLSLGLMCQVHGEKLSSWQFPAYPIRELLKEETCTLTKTLQPEGLDVDVKVRLQFRFFQEGAPLPGWAEHGPTRNARLTATSENAGALLGAPPKPTRKVVCGCLGATSRRK